MYILDCKLADKKEALAFNSHYTAVVLGIESIRKFCNNLSNKNDNELARLLIAGQINFSVELYEIPEFEDIVYNEN